MTKKHISHYIKSKMELTALLNRALKFNESNDNKEFVVFNTSQSVRYEASDIPAELDAIVKTAEKAPGKVCNEIYELYSRLLSSTYDNAHSELPILCDGTNSVTKAEGLLCILCELGALYTMCMDIMEEYVTNAGAKPNELCTPYDERMYGMYSQIGMKLVNEFVDIAY